MLKVVKPELEDLWFRESMMADIETMSYNDAWGGTIPFPKEDWEEWYTLWVRNSGQERYYRYLKDDANKVFVGEISYHFDKLRNIYICDVIIKAEFRKQGFGTQGIQLLCEAAKANGVEALYDNIAADNSSAHLFLKNGFSIEFQNDEILMVKTVL
ncbi:GNAT family N-acetyltransferase [Solobacterium moorei]|uniref:GNAT family N-acetyltransferase n=1 Tax=Solobacterium moorei TaxID=102148 RepID=UPI0028E91F16|nr:GNAT family N-acetyltransferase [Solobacterium moorei]